MPKNSFIIHGHFYQPPRIDPRTGKIPREAGAQPYTNWTERIYHECYLPNAQKENYKWISFNIGPTLAAWLEENHPETLAEIIRQENSVFHAHGISNAMAQPYFHTIMPLMPRREKETLVLWGIEEYTARFGHAPKGMWLPETAVDLESLEVMAENNIQFTILAPWQAKDQTLDITQPYRVQLPGDEKLIVFFYDRFLSSEISFNTSTTMQADQFISDWLIPEYAAEPVKQEKLLLAASDGELYGHHMSEREEFLEYLLQHAVEQANISVTFPGLWLASNPTLQLTEIIENTSWSCHHGIERWRDVCGDAPNATWKAPLRIFLDQLGTAIDDTFFQYTQVYISDPWKLRDAYIDVLLKKVAVEELIQRFAQKQLDNEIIHNIKIMLEAQFERLRMHSSDAWFFFDFDSIEPLNGLKYAAHAVWLIKTVTGKDVSAPLLGELAKASSDESGLTGDAAFRKVLALYGEAHT